MATVAHPTEALWGHGPPPDSCALWWIMLSFIRSPVHCLLYHVLLDPPRPAIMSAMPCFLPDPSQVICCLSIPDTSERLQKHSSTPIMENSSPSPSRSSGYVTPPLSPPPAPEETEVAAVPEEVALMQAAPEDVVEIGVGDLVLDESAPPPLDETSSPPPRLPPGRARG